ncbi:MAG: hypothetical protein FWB96_10600 [Defluviitaleaceae bacterium]|nr:hypothetical protein [Defluviitaleaceae bacterium]MCL2263337.1 hypothetical protein [Defluviitaleaceae bacterium]
MKAFSLLATILTLLVIFTVSCEGENTPMVDKVSGGEENSKSYDQNIPPPPGLPAPAIYVDGRIYFIYGLWGAARRLLDDTYSHIGEVADSVQWIQDATENLQTNTPDYVGAKLYHSGDNLILVVDGQYTLFRFTGERLDCFPN